MGDLSRDLWDLDLGEGDLCELRLGVGDLWDLDLGEVGDLWELRLGERDLSRDLWDLDLGEGDLWELRLGEQGNSLRGIDNKSVKRYKGSLPNVNFGSGKNSH